MSAAQIGEDAEREQHGEKPGVVRIPFNAMLDWRLVGAALAAVAAVAFYADTVLDTLRDIQSEAADTNRRIGNVETALKSLDDGKVSRAEFDGWLVRFDEAVDLWSIRVESVLGVEGKLPRFQAPDLFPKRH